MTGYHALDTLDLVLASVLLLANAALSSVLGLRLARPLLVAGARMIVQLLLVGVVLKLLLDSGSGGLTLLAALVMLAAAAYEVRARQERPLAGWWSYGLGATTMLTAGGIVTVLALLLVIRSDPWFDPRFAIPLFGMILGNAMTGTSLAINTLTTALSRGTREIEARLLLGADRWEACRPVLRQSLRSGFMPIINAMAATGVVSLPGMMTGQIIAGTDPNEAVKYQLLIMFLISGTTGLATIGAVYGTLLRLTDDRDRLRLERLGGPAP